MLIIEDLLLVQVFALFVSAHIFFLLFYVGKIFILSEKNFCQILCEIVKKPKIKMFILFELLLVCVYFYVIYRVINE